LSEQRVNTPFAALSDGQYTIVAVANTPIVTVSEQRVNTPFLLGQARLLMNMPLRHSKGASKALDENAIAPFVAGGLNTRQRPLRRYCRPERRGVLHITMFFQRGFPGAQGINGQMGRW